MKKFGLILFSGFMSLSLASCGLVDKITDQLNQGDTSDTGDDSEGGGSSSGNSEHGGDSEKVSFSDLVNDFESNVRQSGFHIKASCDDQSSGNVFTYNIGLCDQGFWYIHSTDGEFSGYVYKKNGDNYLEYDVDTYGAVSTEYEEVEKDEAEKDWSIDLQTFDVRLFSYYEFLGDDATITDGYYLGRECTEYVIDRNGISLYKFTLDEELKINLKFSIDIAYGGESYSLKFTVNDIKMGSSVSLPM